MKRGINWCAACNKYVDALSSAYYPDMRASLVSVDCHGDRRIITIRDVDLHGDDNPYHRPAFEARQ